MSEKDFNKRLSQIEERLEASFGEGGSSQYEFSSVVAESEGVGLRVLIHLLWRFKWVIIGVTFLFFLFAVFYARSLPNIYRSEVLLVPSEENSGGGIAQMAGQLGGLASLAGLSLGGGNDKTVLALEVLKSREFIGNFIRERKILIPLMASKGWHSGHNELVVDSKIYDDKKSEWLLGQNGVSAPSDQQAYAVFYKLLSVSHDKTSNLVRLAVEHYSPYIAKQWVDWLVMDINQEIRKRDVVEAEKSIEFLKKQMSKTSISEMQSVFYELIEQQTKIVMFAEVRDEYVFKTVDSAIVPEVKTKPKRSVIVVLAAILGAILSVMLVLVYHFVKLEKM